MCTFLNPATDVAMYIARSIYSNIAVTILTVKYVYLETRTET